MNFAQLIYRMKQEYDMTDGAATFTVLANTPSCGIAAYTTSSNDPRTTIAMFRAVLGSEPASNADDAKSQHD